MEQNNQTDYGGPREGLIRAGVNNKKQLFGVQVFVSWSINVLVVIVVFIFLHNYTRLLGIFLPLLHRLLPWISRLTRLHRWH